MQRKHPEHKVSKAPKVITPPKMQHSMREADKVDKELAATRLAGWTALWETMVKPADHMPSAEDIRDMCNAAYDNLPAGWAFYHLICHPDVTDYGPKIVIVGNFNAKCMCNILTNFEPTVEALEELVNDGHRSCHEHWIVAMKTEKSDVANRHRYMQKYFGKGNARLKTIKNKNHFLNTVLYVRGRQASNGVSCHNFGVGLSQEEKKKLRDDVMALDPSYRITKHQLSKFYKKTKKPDTRPDTSFKKAHAQEMSKLLAELKAEIKPGREAKLKAITAQLESGPEDNEMDDDMFNFPMNYH